MSHRILIVVPFICFCWSVATAQTPELPPTKSFKSGDVAIRYRDEGSGQTLVLAHGIGSSSKGMWPVSSGLTKSFHVVSLDQRGFGESDKPKTADDYGTEMVNDLVRLLDHLGKERAHFVGFSMGAAVVAKLAVSHPERVLSATVAAPAPIIRPRKEVEKLVGSIADSLLKRDGVPLLKSSWPEGVPLPPPSALKTMSEGFFKDNDPAAMAACVRGGPELSTEIDERRECPVSFLAIVGSRDKVAAADLKLFMNSIPNKKFVEVKGRGHDLPASDTFWEEVARFLQDNTSPRKQ